MTNKKKKMNAKNILVSFLVIASVLFLATTVSATAVDTDLGNYHDIVIKVDGETITDTTNLLSYVAGDSMTIKVSFTYNETDDDDDNIKVKATIEGESDDVTVSSSSFDVVDGKTYSRTLTLKIPSDFESDELEGEFPLTVEIGDEEVDLGDLYVQRSSYDIAIKSVSTSNSVNAGELLPVEVVLKNVGYDDLDDLYVTVSVAELGISKSGYFGDLVTLAYDGDDDDAEDTVKGTLYLEVPYDVQSGTYTLTATAENDDTESSATTSVVVDNTASETTIKSGNDLTLVNPTDSLRVYKVTYEDQEVSVVVSPASSKTITITTPTSGEYNFNAFVFLDDKLESTVNFSGSSTEETTQVTSPVLALTIILAVVFLVLLVVLVVLITKKPQKTEEFGESYY